MDELVTEGLNEMARSLQGRRFSPGQYTDSDFRRLPGRRYLNIATGEQVSRRQRDRLVGRPLPTRRVTLRMAREAVAAALENGATVTVFRGTIETGMRTRERTIKGPVTIDGEQLQAVADAYRETGRASGFFQAFLDAWWNGAGLYPNAALQELDEFDWELESEPELEDAA